MSMLMLMLLMLLMRAVPARLLDRASRSWLESMSRLEEGESEGLWDHLVARGSRESRGRRGGLVLGLGRGVVGGVAAAAAAAAAVEVGGGVVAVGTLGGSGTAVAVRRISGRVLRDLLRRVARLPRTAVAVAAAVAVGRVMASRAGSSPRAAASRSVAVFRSAMTSPWWEPAGLGRRSRRRWRRLLEWV